jgi:hypothetical protein
MILATRGTRLTPLLATGLDTAVPPCETKDRVGSSVPRLVKLDAFFVKLLSVQPAGLTLLDTPALGLKVVEVVVLWVTVVVVIVVVVANKVSLIVVTVELVEVVTFLMVGITQTLATAESSVISAVEVVVPRVAGVARVVRLGAALETMKSSGSRFHILSSSGSTSPTHNRLSPSLTSSYMPSKDKTGLGGTITLTPEK